MADNSLGRFEPIQKSIERRVVIALRKAPPLFRNDKRHMGVHRMPQTEQFLQIQLLRRGAKQIDAAHDRVHPLLRIVYDHGQLVRERPVRALYKEIAALAIQVLTVRLLYLIVEGYGLIGNRQSLMMSSMNIR